MTKVVVIDDEPKICLLCVRILELGGMEATSFTNPIVALEHLRAEPPDVVLADVRMPEMDGFEVLGQIRECCPSTAVIIMTAYGELEVALKALHSGADGMLLKPFQSNQALVDAVNQGLAQRKRAEEMARLHALLPLLKAAELLLSESATDAGFAALAVQIKSLFPDHDFGVYGWEGNGQAREFVAHNIPVATQEMQSWLDRWLREECQASGCIFSPTLEAETNWSDALAVGVRRESRLYLLLLGRRQGKFAPAERTTAEILTRLIASALENHRLYTDLQRSIENERRSREALLRAEQMAALGRMMASLAHELNNPLQALQNSFYLAQHNKEDCEKFKHYIEIAQHPLERLVTIAKRMLNFYRPNFSHRAMVSLPELISEVAQELSKEAKERDVKINVQLSQSPKDLAIFAVREHIKYALWRLATEMLESMIAEGELKFIGWAEGKDAVLKLIATTRPNHYPMEAESKKGTGSPHQSIGAAISEGIIAAHGGHLSIGDEHNDGKRVAIIRLPLEAN